MHVPGSFRASLMSNARLCPTGASVPFAFQRLAALAVCAAAPAFAQFIDAPLSASISAITSDTAMKEPRPQKPDFTREIEENKSYLIPAWEIPTFQLLLNRFDNAHFGCCD